MMILNVRTKEKRFNTCTSASLTPTDGCIVCVHLCGEMEKVKRSCSLGNRIRCCPRRKSVFQQKSRKDFIFTESGLLSRPPFKR